LYPLQTVYTCTHLFDLSNEGMFGNLDCPLTLTLAAQQTDQTVFHRSLLVFKW